jgi:hypothetical protein
VGAVAVANVGAGCGDGGDGGLQRGDNPAVVAVVVGGMANDRVNDPLTPFFAPVCLDSFETSEQVGPTPREAVSSDG